jgi:hypothetical protein
MAHCRFLHGTPGQVGFAPTARRGRRNDKKERVVVSVGLLPWDSAVVGAAGTGWLAAYEGYCGQILAAALAPGEEEVVDSRPGMIAKVVGLA